MKIITKLVLAIAVIALVACSSSTSSSDDTVSENSPIVIDEAKQTLTIYYSITNSSCVQKDIKDSTSLTWKSTQTKDTLLLQYSFIGDTLVLRFIEDGSTSNVGEVFAGGKNGTIYGTWTKLSNCKARGSQISCNSDEDDEEIITIKISESSIKSTTVYKTNDEYDFVNTDLVKDIIRIILDYSNTSIYASDITEYSNIGSKFNDEIQILNSSKTDVTFVYESKNYKISISGKISSDDYNVAASVSGDGQKTCKLNIAASDVTKDLCKLSNYDNLNFTKEYIDEEDEEYSSSSTDLQESIESYQSKYVLIAQSYSEDNTYEFENCLRSWNGQTNQDLGTDDNTYSTYYYKKQSDNANVKLKAEKKQFEAFLKAIAQ